MTDEQKRLVDKLMNTQHDMVVVIAQSAYAEATLVAAQREIRELREVANTLHNINHALNDIGCDPSNECWDECCDVARDILRDEWKKLCVHRATLEQAMGEKS
jgi:hypothetical protein